MRAKREQSPLCSKNKASAQTAKRFDSLFFSGGSDETRTRDLRRDRASFQCMNKRSALKPQRFRDLLRPVSPSWTPSNPKSGNKLGTKRIQPVLIIGRPSLPLR